MTLENNSAVEASNNNKESNVCVDESKVETEKPKLADGFFEIEAVRRKRVRKGEIQYLIKWREWPETSNTWEPLSNLQSCSDVIEAFEESLHSGKQKKGKRKNKDDTQLQSKKKTLMPKGRGPGLVSANELSIVDPAAPQCIGSAPERPSDVGFVSSEIAQDQDYNEEKKNENELKHETFPKVHEQNGYENSANDSGVPKTNGAEPGPSTLSKGSRRRKPKSVKRFTRDSASNEPDANLGAGSTVDRRGPVDSGSVVPSRRTGELRKQLRVTEIIMPISFTVSVLNNVQDVEVKFFARRSDGTEVVVDNKYLKDHNPLLLINFYEKNLKNSPNIPC